MDVGWVCVVWGQPVQSADSEAPQTKRGERGDLQPHDKEPDPHRPYGKPRRGAAGKRDEGVRKREGK